MQFLSVVAAVEMVNMELVLTAAVVAVVVSLKDMFHHQQAL
jgi:hypothetical protein